MAVTPFEFPPLFRKPKNVEIPKRLGVRAVVVDYWLVGSYLVINTSRTTVIPGFK